MTALARPGCSPCGRPVQSGASSAPESLASILCSEHKALGTRNTQDMKKGAPTVHGIAHKSMEMHPESNRAEGSSQAGLGECREATRSRACLFYNVHGTLK